MTVAVVDAKLPTRSTARAISVCVPAGHLAPGICARKVRPSASGAETVNVLPASVNSMRCTARLSTASTATSSVPPRLTAGGTLVNATDGGSDGSTV